MIFLHIPKCGGTSFTQLIRDQIGECLYFPNDASLQESLGPELDNARAIGGHLYHYTLQGFFPERKRIVLLRDPFERLVSSFRYSRDAVAINPSGVTDHQRAMASMTFEEFFESSISRSEKHMAMYMLGLLPSDRANEVPMSLLFAQACAALNNYSVGIVENLDDFVKNTPEFRSKKSDYAKIPKENVTVSSPINLDKTFVAKCRKELRYDILFYKYAIILSQDQIKSNILTGDEHSVMKDHNVYFTREIIKKIFGR